MIRVLSPKNTNMFPLNAAYLSNASIDPHYKRIHENPRTRPRRSGRFEPHRKETSHIQSLDIPTYPYKNPGLQFLYQISLQLDQLDSGLFVPRISGKPGSVIKCIKARSRLLQNLTRPPPLGCLDVQSKRNVKCCHRSWKSTRWASVNYQSKRFKTNVFPKKRSQHKTTQQFETWKSLEIPTTFTY